MAVVTAVVIVTSMTKRTNDGIHDHEHEPKFLTVVLAGINMGVIVVVAAPAEVAAIIITCSGRVPVAIQWIVNIAVLVANDSTSGIGKRWC